MRALRCVPALLALLCGALAGPAGATLQPPVVLAEDTDVLLGIGQDLAHELVLPDGLPHVFHGSRSGYFEYAWNDGLSWRAQVVSTERVHALEALVFGGQIHVAALLAAGDAAPQLVYLVFAPRSGLPLRRVVLATPALRSVHLALNEQGTAPVVIAQYTTGSVRRFDNLAGAVGESGFPALEGLNDLALLDVARSPGGPLWLLHAFRPGAAPTVRQLRVLALRASGPPFVESVTEEVLSLTPGARLAITNDGQPLVAYGDSAGHQAWRRRQASGAWTCPQPTPCMLTLKTANLDLMEPPSIRVADDAGGGYVAVTGRREQTGAIWLRRLHTSGAVTDAQQVAAASIADLRVASVPALGDFLLYQRVRSRTVADTVSNLVLQWPAQQPWRSYFTTQPTRSALALALDPAGEPVAIGDGGAGVGLRRSRWNPTESRIDMGALRPSAERYATAAAAFASDRTLHVLALSSDDGLLYHLVQTPTGGLASRDALGVGSHPAVPLQLAVDHDEALLALWWEPSGNRVRLGRRPPGGSWSIADLPGSHGPDARPRLALSQTGMVFVSLHDPMARRIDVYERASADGAAPFTLRMRTDPFVSSAVHALAATRDARPALAYARAGSPGDTQWVAYRYPLECCAPDAPVFDLAVPLPLQPTDEVTHVQLALVDGSPSDSRIVLARRDDVNPQHEVVFARRTATAASDAFETFELGSLQASDAEAGLALVATGTAAYLAAVDAQNLQLLREQGIGPLDGEMRTSRLAPIHSDATPASEPERRYNDGWIIHLCVCLIEACNGGATLAGRTPAGGQGELSARLRARFAQSAAGARYLGLFAQHGLEMANLTLADPGFFRERIGTFGLFLPGLLGFAEGTGDQWRMSADMLRRAERVWRHYAEQGSPGLRATIEAELARTNNLQSFAGGTFDDWFANLPGEPALFGDGFEAQGGR